jgi:hypothetical protein
VWKQFKRQYHQKTLYILLINKQTANYRVKILIQTLTMMTTQLSKPKNPKSTNLNRLNLNNQNFKDEVRKKNYIGDSIIAERSEIDEGEGESESHMLENDE